MGRKRPLGGLLEPRASGATDKELAARLAAIVTGPWATSTEARKSLDYLRPPMRLDLEAPTLDFSADGIAALAYEDDQDLPELLAAHWVRPIEPSEAWLRIGLDEALTAPMLLELAVECGYLDVAAVTAPARLFLAELLWSKAVQTYIKDYDYFSVSILAQRVGIRLRKTAALPELPPIDPDGATVFSTFFAYYRSFAEDRYIWRFLELLDDYTSDDDSDKHDLWTALGRANVTHVPDTVTVASEGAIRFIEHLSTIDRLGQGPRRLPFAFFYAYWLAKFFGYELRARGYRKSKHEYDWSTRIPALAKAAHTTIHDADTAAFAAGARSLWHCALDESSKYAKAFTW